MPLTAYAAFAQSNPLYISFRPGATKGALYKPDNGPAPHVAILPAHRTSGGHYLIRDNEVHYEPAASRDKDFIAIEGAAHGVTSRTACEKTPGQYSNATKNQADYVAKWIDARF